MKTPLYYQMTEYDCGPISLLNGINYLFDRESIPPEILKVIMGICLDSYGEKGEYAKKGTSQDAMRYLCFWLNQLSKAKQFPLLCEYLRGDEVVIDCESRIIKALKNNNAVILRVECDGEHYVLLTGTQNNTVSIFDPYLSDTQIFGSGIERVFHSSYCNMHVSFEVLNGKSVYSMCDVENRDAIIFNST